MRSTGHDYKLETRKLSCYCLNCLEEIDQCQNIDYCQMGNTNIKSIEKYNKKAVRKHGNRTR